MNSQHIQQGIARTRALQDAEAHFYQKVMAEYGISYMDAVELVARQVSGSGIGVSEMPSMPSISMPTMPTMPRGFVS